MLGSMRYGLGKVSDGWWWWDDDHDDDDGSGLFLSIINLCFTLYTPEV